MSISNYMENVLLDIALATAYVKLHTGDPGENGTSNAAANVSRQPAHFPAASGGATSNDGVIDWTNVPNAETYSHVSLWDASSGGNCTWTGALTAAKTVAIGDTFEIPVGDLDVTLD